MPLPLVSDLVPDEVHVLPDLPDPDGPHRGEAGRIHPRHSGDLVKGVLPVQREEFLGCVVVNVSEYPNPNGYPKKRPAGTTCEFCGKPVRDPEPWHITGVDGNVIWICSIDDATKMEKEDRGFMGAWPIGPECGRKLRQAITDIGLDPDKYVVRLAVPPSSP